MQTSHYFRCHGFIVLLLAMLLSFVSSFASTINGSYNARGIKIHSEQKRILSAGSKPRGGGIPPPGKEYPQCGFNDPHTDGPIFESICNKGYVHSEIKSADYGQPQFGSSCQIKRGNCGAPATLRLVKENCIGKRECRLYITDEMFGPTHCKGPVRFAYSVICKII